jgi:hypothetical protein
LANSVLEIDAMRQVLEKVVMAGAAVRAAAGQGLEQRYLAVRIFAKPAASANESPNLCAGVGC